MQPFFCHFLTGGTTAQATPIAKRGRPTEVPPELTEFLTEKLKAVDWKPEKMVACGTRPTRIGHRRRTRMMVRREIGQIRGELRLPIMDNCSIVNPLNHTTGKVCKKSSNVAISYISNLGRSNLPILSYRHFFRNTCTVWQKDGNSSMSVFVLDRIIDQLYNYSLK